MQQSNFVTKCDRLLLQNVSCITKRDSYYKVRRNINAVNTNVGWVLGD